MTVTPTEVPASGAGLPAPTEFAEVKGWFFAIDQVMFDWFLSRQQRLGEAGDLLEVGAYMGKSAIFLGSYLREGDTFTVCDLFDTPAQDDANSAEMRYSYASLTRHSFEANYLSFHDELPRVLQGLSSMVRGEVAPGSCRFAHVDASHLYEHVRADIEGAAELLHPQGIVALDDYRSEHTPGVAAATWEAVVNHGLKPVCVSGTKFYGTWGDADPIREELTAFLDGRPDVWHEVQSVAGHPLVRVKGMDAVLPPQPPSRHQKPPQPEPQPAPEPVATPEAQPEGRHKAPGRTGISLLLVNVLPPFITKAVIRFRNARRRRNPPQHRVEAP
jgi:hypothetical protein